MAKHKFVEEYEDDYIDLENLESEFSNDNSIFVLPEFDEVIILEKNKNNRLQDEIFVV